MFERHASMSQNTELFHLNQKKIIKVKSQACMIAPSSSNWLLVRHHLRVFKTKPEKYFATCWYDPILKPTLITLNWQISQQSQTNAESNVNC